MLFALLSRPSGRRGRFGMRPAVTLGAVAALIVVLARTAETAPAPDALPSVAAAAAQPQGPLGLSGPAWAMHALGPFYGGVFFGLAVLLVALLVLNLRSIRREGIVPASLVERFEELVGRRRYQEAFDTARDDPSPLGRVLEAAMARLSFGYGQAVEAMQEAAEEENMKMEHRLSYLALVGTIAPMVGLLGTVHGMIASFTVIATLNQTPRPWQLAGGISTALFTTLIGLAIAIPAIAAYNILRNRLARLALEVNLLGEDIMLRLSKGVKPTGTKGTPR